MLQSFEYQQIFKVVLHRFETRRVAQNMSESSRVESIQNLSFRVESDSSSLKKKIYGINRFFLFI